LNLLPERWALLAGEGVGWAAGTLFRIRRKVVDEHLRHAFPEMEDAWRSRVARASYRHLGREGVATFRWARLSPKEIRERTEIEGLDVLEAAVREERGVVLVTGHFGSWEIGGATVAAYGVPLDVIARRQRNPLFDREINQARERLKMRIIERGDARRRVLRSLRDGRVVAFVGDQDARDKGVFVEFMGRGASTARGAAFFALRTECPLVAAFICRKSGFPQRYRLSVRRIPLDPTDDQEADVIRLTEAHTRYLEARVREHPEQYFWQHRRWKTRPPEETGAGEVGLV
jgi:KDO2-lipid IV(A) lauroyltransferase